MDDSQVLTNVPANAVFTDTVYTHPSSHPISMITGLQAALDAKQPTLSTGAGCFLNGSAISSYSLRWNGSSTPSVATAIQELHWDNYTMTETVNIGTGKIELTIGHPTDMATQTWANTQLALKANDAAVTTAFAGVQLQLAGKQDTITATLPLSKNGSVLSSVEAVDRQCR